MSYTWMTLFSFSIWIAAVIGVARFKNLDPIYHPFIYCTWVAAFNELLSYSLIAAGASNAINNNCYILVETIFIIWQFKKWDALQRFTLWYTTVIVLIILAWLIENFVLANLTKTVIYCRVLYATIIICLSVNTTSFMIVNERDKLIRNPVFIICMSYIIFFSYKIIMELCWYYGLSIADAFTVYVFRIFTWVNLFVNLLFSIVIIWIPSKPRYISL